MRYLDPSTIIMRRLAGRARPGWQGAVLIHHGYPRALPLVERLAAEPIPQRLLSLPETPNAPHLFGTQWGRAKVAVVIMPQRTAEIVEELAELGVSWIIAQDRPAAWCRSFGRARRWWHARRCRATA